MDLLMTTLAQGGDATGGGEASPLVNWWTVAAQIANFLILVALLRWLLYDRILEAMDRREQRIADRWDQAEQSEQEARQKAAELERQMNDIEQKRGDMLQEARADADRRRSELREQARKDVDEQARRWRHDLAREKQSLLGELADRSGRHVCQATRTVLEELADAELEQRMAEVFAGRLAELSDEDRRELADAAGEADGGLVVATAWELPDEARKRLSDAVTEHVSDKAEVGFETAAEITCGIELRAGGREVSWTVDAYLQGLRDELADLIDEQTRSTKDEQADDEQAGQQAEPDGEAVEEGDKPGDHAGREDGDDG